MISTTQLGSWLVLFPLGATALGCSEESDGEVFTSAPETTAFVGQEYSYTATTRGGGPRTLTAVEVPRWLTFTDHEDGTGLLRGIPTPVDTGMHRVELHLEGDNGIHRQTFDIEVLSDFTEIGQDDDFDGDELKPFWRFYDPRGTSELTLADGTASISVEGGPSHNLWLGNDNQAPRLLQAVEDRDFGVEAKFASMPQERFQMQGIVAQERDDKFVRLDLHHNGDTLRVYAAYIDGIHAQVRLNRAIEGISANHLRVLRNGEYWTLQYSDNGEDWLVASAFSQPLVVHEIGVFAGNAHGPDSPAFTAVIDSFRNTDLTNLPDIELPDGPDVQPDPPGGDLNEDDDTPPDDSAEEEEEENVDDPDPVEPPQEDTPDDDDVTDLDD